jgi:hypothetical protein
MPKISHIHKVGKEIPEIQVPFLQQDPLVARSTGNYVGIRMLDLPGEPFLGAGPTSGRVAVVDYNGDLDQTFAPVLVLNKGNGFAVGKISVRHLERNFSFHQVNVWATVLRTLSKLESERVFGRPIPWAFSGGRLLIMPHAGYWENAFYDRGTGALHFFYFEDPNGRPIFTCLSHDIVTHELGHAVLDGLKPYYNEVCSPDTAGFHEYFGDAVAMVSALTQREIAVLAAGDAPRKLTGRDLIAKIASQFGSAIYGSASRDYLRTAENTLTMDDIQGNWEEHDYSQVLTGTFYDVLKTLYEDEIPRQKEHRNAPRIDGQICVASLINAADYTTRIMLRALDYCPPVDISYRDYAQAVIRADEVAYPTDKRGYRKIVGEIMRKRRIVHLESELNTGDQPRNASFHKYDIDTISATPTDAYRFLDANREKLNIPRNVNFRVTSLYRTRKVSTDKYYPPREVVLEFVWAEDLNLKGRQFGALSGKSIPLWCGGTLVFDSIGNVLHYTMKPATEERRQRLRDYIEYLEANQILGLSGNEEGLGAFGQGTHRVTATIQGSRVMMKRNAALRHEGRPLE